MTRVRQSIRFAKWLRRLPDERARAKIVARIQRLVHANPGDTRVIGRGVRELRIDYGPGYRVYYAIDGADIVLLLGGHKGSQVRDVRTALILATQL